MGVNGVILMQRSILAVAFHLTALNGSVTTEEIQIEVEAEMKVRPGFEWVEFILSEEFTELDEPEIDHCWVDLT